MKFTGVIAFVATAASVVSAAPLEGRASDNGSLGNLAPVPVTNAVGSVASVAGNGLGAVTDPVTNIMGGGRNPGSGGLLGGLLGGGAGGLGGVLSGLLGGGAGGGAGGLLGGLGGIVKRSDE